ALVATIVEQHLLLAVTARKLAPLVAVGERDRETHAGAGRGCTIERHTTLHEGAEHGEETAAGALDRRRVGTVFRDIAVLVEQVGARDAHIREVQAAIVDAVEATLVTVILTADA